MIISLNEVYYGKTKNLKEAEELLASIKADYDGDYYNATAVMVDKRFMQMQEKIASEFGLKCFYIDIEASKEINAMTMPISWAIECMPTCRLDKNLIVDRRGMKFKEDAGVVIVTTIFSGLLLNPNYSAGEIMAILLHEIGHNFQTVIDDTMFYLTDASHVTVILRCIINDIMHGNAYGAITDLATPILASNFVKNVEIKLAKTLYDVKFTRYLAVISDNIFGRINTGKAMLNRLITCAIGYISIVNPGIIIQQLLQGIIGTILDPIGYRGEQIADNFATIYGYGPELNTALMRMQTEHNFGDTYEEYFNKSFLGKVYRTGIGVAALSGSCLDVHPNSVERCLAQVRYLKTELNKTKMNPELKKDLKRQIDLMENNLADIMSNPNLDERWDVFRYAYASMIYEDGGDMRHKTFMGKDIHQNIQKRYDSPKHKIKLI